MAITFKQFLLEAGSTGKQKWEKYFAGNTVETIIKNDCIALHIDTLKPTSVTIKRGEKITVINQEEYTTKPIIEYDGKQYRVKLDDIDKPFKMAQTLKFTLKPDSLGIVGKFKMSDYVKSVKNKIDNHHEIPEDVAGYLKALVDLAKDPENSDFVDSATDLYTMAEVKSDQSLKNTITNDFMEVLGPLFVLNENSEFKRGHCKFPESGSEPLYDFIMIDEDGEETLCSSKKSGGKSNTLKVDVVIDTCLDNPKLKRKYKKELELLQIIKNSSVKSGPSEMDAWLADNYADYEQEEQKPTDGIGISSLARKVVEYINKRSGLDFTNMVNASISEIWLVKAKLANDGTIVVEPLNGGAKLENVKLRSKLSPNHTADKIGFDLS